MTTSDTDAGYFPCGIPFNRLGQGLRPLLLIQGLLFENKPNAMMAMPYKFLGQAYTLYSVLRQPGLPAGCTLRDMSESYAELIRSEFGGPVDVLGVSTGGSIAQILAADHPELVRRLVLHSAAYKLSEPARELQKNLARLAAEGKWVRANYVMLTCIIPQKGLRHILALPLAWLGGLAAGLLAAPKSASDLVVTVEAEDQLNFKDRLSEICAPTLLICGEDDPFYTPELFRETAAGIPNARLVMYPNQGHAPAGKQFEAEVISFLSN